VQEEVIAANPAADKQTIQLSFINSLLSISLKVILKI
jgi:hypothetical protein